MEAQSFLCVVYPIIDLIWNNNQLYFHNYDSALAILRKSICNVL